MAKKYRVTAPCVVHIPVSTSEGPMLGTFYQDAILPDGVPADKVKHLLDSNLIVEVGGDAQAVEEDADVQGGDQPPVEPKVNSRSTKGDLANYAVLKGDMTRDEADAMTRDQLLARYVNKQPETPAE